MACLCEHEGMALSAANFLHEVADLADELGHVDVLKGAQAKLPEVVAAEHVEVA